MSQLVSGSWAGSDHTRREGAVWTRSVAVGGFGARLATWGMRSFQLVLAVESLSRHEAGRTAIGFTMALSTAILLGAAIGGLVLALTGWWRLAFAPFHIRAGRMTVARLGLAVEDASDADRVNTLLRSFAGGFNRMLSSPSATAWEAYSDSLPVIYRPFAHEGGAMGYTARRLFRYDPADFESRIVRRRPEMRYLYYVGLGFWSGIRNHSAARVQQIADGLDPLHAYLCYDGYGFKRAFFDYPADAQALSLLDNLGGYARNAAYQGVGRAFFFRYADRPDLLIEHASRTGKNAAEIAAGVGLASVFVFPDRLGKAQSIGSALPAEWRDQFHLGMCFALKARSITEPDQFQRDMEVAPPGTAEAAFLAIRECDRVELQVRARRDEQGYRHWREEVRQWMADHIEFPLRGVKASATERSPGRSDALASI